MQSPFIEPVFGSDESAYLWTLGAIIALLVIGGVVSLIRVVFRDAWEELKRDLSNLK